MRFVRPAIFPVLGVCLVLTACEDSPPAAEKTSAPATSTPEPPAAAPKAPTTEHSPKPDALPPAQAGGLRWDDAAPLVRRPPKSPMRAAEYGLEGEPRAELSVFYFGPDQGGTVDANVTRWLGQFTQPDGSDSAQKAKRSEQKVGGIDVTIVEVAGTFSGGMGMPGGAAPSALPDAQLLGAIASGPRGPVFFKFVGPRTAVEAARPGFNALIGSLRAENPAP